MRGRTWLAGPLMATLCGCASDLERSGEPYAWISYHELSIQCVSSSVPDELLGEEEDAEAKLLPGDSGDGAGVGTARRVLVDGKELAGIYIVMPAAPLCDPYDQAGSTAAVARRGGRGQEIAKLGELIDLVDVPTRAAG